MINEESLNSMRDAVRLSPDNMPLRQALAEMLMSLGRAEEAEAEFRQALAKSPQDAKLKLGLASAFNRQGKTSQAMVIVEDLVKQASPPPKALMLHARLALKAGNVELAVRQYKKAIGADASVADEDLAERLGIRAGSADEDSPAWDEAELIDGKLRGTEAPGGSPLDAPVEKPAITFKDVGGMEAVKEEIRLKIIHPLTHADLYKAYGKPIGGGILMYGPPGCGKTHLARATAGEIRASFIAVGINDVLDIWIGSSEKNLHGLFDQARRNKPCVLFFDEVDALAANRSDMRQHAGRHLINQFLAEMDGVKSSNDGVLILAATNAPWHLDPAFRRPGRFDRILFVPPPDGPARASILQILTKGKPADEIDFDGVARKTEHFSGADLKAVLDIAIEAKLREAMKTGVPKPLTAKDLAAAAATIKPSTREWFASAKNYALYSNQGGVYDEILKYLKI